MGRMDLTTEPSEETTEVKIVFRMDNYYVALQKSLHKQWLDGQNCDMTICTHSCDFSVHSCVAASFCTKIHDHLLQASMTMALASLTGVSTYDSDDGEVKVSVLKSGEKRIQMDADGEMLELLVRFMYTGALHVPQQQALTLFHLAQLIGMTVVANAVQVYMERNPDTIGSHAESINGGSNSNENIASLQLDSVELNTQSESVDEDLAAYISSPAYVEGVSPETGVRTKKRASARLASRTHKKRKAVLKDSKDISLPLNKTAIKKCALNTPEKFEKITDDRTREEELVMSEVTDTNEGCTREEELVMSEVSDTNEGDTREEELVMSVVTDTNEGDTREELVMSVVTDTNEDDTREEELVMSVFTKLNEGDTREELVMSVVTDTNEESFSSYGESCRQICNENEAKIAFKRFERGEKEEKLSVTPLSFSCDFCPKQYHSLAELKLHRERKHRFEIFSTSIMCPKLQCDKQFHSLAQYRAHCKDMHGDFVCEIKSCTYTASSQKKIQLHDSCAHKGKFRCAVCQECSSTKCGLARHHNNAHAPMVCLVCKKTIIGKTRLIEHKKSLHSHKCERCKKIFVTESELDAHLKRKKVCSMCKPGHKQSLHHAGLEMAVQTEKNMEKDLLNQTKTTVIKTEQIDEENTCSFQSANSIAENTASLELEANKTSSKRKNVSFSSSCLLKSWCKLCNKQMDCEDAYCEHLKQKHYKETFPCNMCNRVFLRKESLTKHIFSYHEERKLVCPYCAKVFTVSAHYSKHCQSEHGDKAPFHCQVCKYRSSNAKCLRTHCYRIHEERRQLEICDKCGGSFLHLKIHQLNCLRLEQHLCQTCGEVFNLRAYLLSHISVVHRGEKAYACHICHRRFSCNANRKRHLRIHDNTFPYTCEICGQKFRHSNSMKEHIKHSHAKKS